MTVVSLSGMILLGFFRRKRLIGFATAVAGGLVCYLVWHLWVP